MKNAIASASHFPIRILEKVVIVTRLQKICYEIFSTVTASLQIGMSEVDIAEKCRLEFKKRGIEEHWYDVPQHASIGTERFKISTTTSDYSIKRPQPDVFLSEGDVIHIDFSPVDPKTKVWGDWSSTLVFHPRKSVDEEQLDFLSEFRNIQLEGIKQITAETTGAEVATYYLDICKQKGITLLDVRNNIGHSIHAGPKAKAERIWLDLENDHPLGEGVFTIEPGGCREKKDGKGIVVARFEECIYIPPTGHAQILGYSNDPPPLV